MGTILAVNSGSSTLKFAFFDGDTEGPAVLFEGSAEDIGRDGGKLVVRNHEGAEIDTSRSRFKSQPGVLEHVVERMRTLAPDLSVDAVGHRIVHGGPELTTHQRILPKLIQTLERNVNFAPLHIPASLELIHAAERLYPGTPQFACFDTAFHRTLPEEAFRYPVPVRFRNAGVRRYGFHGLSCESIVRSLGAALKSRTVIAHLGSGSSVTAVRDGKSVDTSMGMTPTGGVPMGSRPGDLDPGVVTFMMRSGDLDARALESMLNHECGLKALAGTADVRQIEAHAEDGSADGNEDARLAIEIFCRSIAKTIAGYASVLGGLEMLVFAGGIGEHSARVRGNVCERLAFLGVELDSAGNAASAPLLSVTTSRCEVRIVASREEQQIAYHAERLLEQKPE